MRKQMRKKKMMMASRSRGRSRRESRGVVGKGDSMSQTELRPIARPRLIRIEM